MKKIHSIKLIAFTLLWFTISYTLAQPQFNLELFAEGLKRPVSIDHMGDSRLFVVEKNGRIMILDSLGHLNPEPFLDIKDRVRVAGNEMGLLGMAFHPEYEANGYFYVNYNATSPLRTIISRFERDPANPNHALPSSEKKLLVIEQPYRNHNGGCLRFGPDGYLYIGMGDGGSANDPENRAQNPKEFLGKMLRIDVDHGDPYAIPPDNPFIGDSSVLPEIWAMGMRNPWRFSFDRLTGDLFIGDVGQGAVEEIDLEPAGSGGGRNYGWRCYEGTAPHRTNGCKDISQFIFPIYEYRHRDGNCSITGGYIYRGSRYPELYGLYFYADYCSGYVAALKRLKDSSWSNVDLGYHDAYSYVSFGENRDGELFLAGYEGNIYKITGDTVGVSSRTPSLSPGGSIAPNPAGDYFVFYRGDLSSPGLKLYLIDGQGVLRDIIEMKEEPEKRISLSTYPDGIYWLRAVWPEGQKLFKVIKLSYLK